MVENWACSKGLWKEDLMAKHLAGNSAYQMVQWTGYLMVAQMAPKKVLQKVMTMAPDWEQDSESYLELAVMECERRTIHWSVNQL
jgi:hypothetical protein